MMRRVLLAGVLAALAFTPAAAQQPSSAPLKEAVATFVQQDRDARHGAALALVRNAGFSPTVETFEAENAPPGRNIVFTFGRGAREILLVAHYDAVKLSDGTWSHGVVDNAASVVAVVEAAKRLQGVRLSHRVRVILFDHEELGLLGAKAWIKQHGIANVAAVVNSDVAGYGDTLMYGLNNGPQSAPLVRAVRAVCAERAQSCMDYAQYPPSDDRAFSAVGAPVVSLGFQDAIGARQMWLAFNAPRESNGLAAGFLPEVFRTIHTPLDRMEKIDAATLERAAGFYAALVREIDRNAPRR
jgi:Zn-dependent M28 family amino/carboxypeptidase